jgi:hypothetical protein
MDVKFLSLILKEEYILRVYEKRLEGRNNWRLEKLHNEELHQMQLE